MHHRAGVSSRRPARRTCKFWLYSRGYSHGTAAPPPSDGDTGVVSERCVLCSARSAARPRRGGGAAASVAAESRGIWNRRTEIRDRTTARPLLYENVEADVAKVLAGLHRSVDSPRIGLVHTTQSTHPPATRKHVTCSFEDGRDPAHARTARSQSAAATHIHEAWSSTSRYCRSVSVTQPSAAPLPPPKSNLLVSS